jgi:ABC-type multidrug transport system fused ATPase/permease subunit
MLLLYNLLGWASLVGVVLMVASLIVPILLARVLARIQKELRLASDARIGLMVSSPACIGKIDYSHYLQSETLTAVRVIKFFGLEDAFLERIRGRREKELKLSLKSSMLALVFHTISKSLPIINIVCVRYPGENTGGCRC